MICVASVQTVRICPLTGEPTAEQKIGLEDMVLTLAFKQTSCEEWVSLEIDPQEAPMLRLAISRALRKHRMATATAQPKSARKDDPGRSGLGPQGKPQS